MASMAVTHRNKKRIHVQTEMRTLNLKTTTCGVLPVVVFILVQVTTNAMQKHAGLQVKRSHLFLQLLLVCKTYKKRVVRLYNTSFNIDVTRFVGLQTFNPDEVLGMY